MSVLQAAVAASLLPGEALRVSEDLINAQRSIVLGCDLHLIFLITPTDVESAEAGKLWGARPFSDQAGNPFQTLALRMEDLDVQERLVEERLGINRGFINKKANGGTARNAKQ